MMLSASILMFAAAALVAAGAWGSPLTIAIVNGCFNLANIALTMYVMQITSGLDRRSYFGGE